MNRSGTALKPLARREPEFFDPSLSPEPVVIDGVFRDEYLLPYPAPSLDRILGSLGHLPAYSVLIGMCEDGLPFLMDLRNPAPGSILITGEQGSGKTKFLISLLASAAKLNSPEQVSFCLVTPHVDEMEALAQLPHCQSMAAPYERRASEIIMTLSAIAEQRRSGRELGPAIVLAIDDLAYLAGEFLDYSVYVHLKWLLRNGPQSMIWPVVTVSAEQAYSVDRQLMNSFKTRFDGNPAASGMARQFDLTAPEPSGYYLPEPSFGVRHDNEWIRFLVPSL
jgi:hypothetical protein